MVSFPYSSGIFEGSCECTGNLDHPLGIAMHSSDVCHEGHAKVTVFHTVISRGLIEGYDCKRQILLVVVVYGFSDVDR
jgi:hypothetical protein